MKWKGGRIVKGEWVHVGVVVRERELRVYVDGREEGMWEGGKEGGKGEGLVFGHLEVDFEIVYVGGDLANSGHFWGMLADVKMVGKELTSEEVFFFFFFFFFFLEFLFMTLSCSDSKISFPRLNFHAQ